MSSSSLYVLDPNFNGFESEEYRNSWFFSPIVWDVLLDKYMHDEIQTPHGYKKSLIGLDGDKLHHQLNEIINHCDSLSDRICWELSNQQVFFTTDKQIVAQGIQDFLTHNTQFHLSDEEGVSYLAFEHITDRFRQIASDISEIDEAAYPHFVFKNTSVDDSVEYWFYQDDSNKSLRDWDKVVAEFVKINDGKIKFTDNLTFFKPQESAESEG